MSSFDYRIRPFRPGAGIGHSRGSRGTACIKVELTSGSQLGKRFLLSCQHVLFPNFRIPASSEYIVQPSKKSYKMLLEADVVGAQYQHANLTRSGENEIDAALAYLRLPYAKTMINKLMEQSLSLRGISNSFTIGDKVEMYGSKSGRQIGEIINVATRTELIYPETSGSLSVIRFKNVAKCEYKNDRGDSGAPVVLFRNKKLIGMHIGGDSNFGYFCHISKIFSALRIRIAQE